MDSNLRTNHEGILKVVQAIQRLRHHEPDAPESVMGGESTNSVKEPDKDPRLPNSLLDRTSPLKIPSRRLPYSFEGSTSLLQQNLTMTYTGRYSLDAIRNEPPIKEDATTCQSDILKMFQNVGEKRETLLNALVLTAEKDVVEAGSCVSVMSKKFGDLGLKLLHHIAYALESCEYMFVELIEEHIAVTAHEPRDTLSQALLWLCLAIRIPRAKGISLSTGTVQTNYRSEQVKIDNLKVLSPSSNSKSCWHPLFESGIVAVEPSVDYTHDSWLQVDFTTLVKLAAVEYPVKVGSGIVLLGYSTALIPIKMLDDEVLLWHLEVCSHESQFKLFELQATKTTWLMSKDVELLKTKTARVGWCSKSNVLLGTSNLLQSRIGWSTGSTQKNTWKWKGASLQAVAASSSPLQLGLQGGATFERVSNTLRFDAGQNYLKMLRSSAREAVILYDVETKRAWLVPLLSVLHHMAIIYCKYNTIDDETKNFPIPFAKPSANGGESSRRSLRQSGGVYIEQGGDDTLILRDLLMGFSTNMAKIAPHKPRYKKVFGYEFMDVVQEVPTANLKRVHIKKGGKSWTPLLQFLPCLFCSNLGDAIVKAASSGANPDCHKLASERDYLAASVHCLNDISKRQGRNSAVTTRYFPGDLSWRPTQNVFWGCNHTDESTNCWDCPGFIQRISPKKLHDFPGISQQRIAEDGAIVFGEKGPSTLDSWFD